MSIYLSACHIDNISVSLSRTPWGKIIWIYIFACIFLSPSLLSFDIYQLVRTYRQIFCLSMGGVSIPCPLCLHHGFSTIENLLNSTLALLNQVLQLKLCTAYYSSPLGSWYSQNFNDLHKKLSQWATCS